jgi:hypothetical protein
VRRYPALSGYHDDRDWIGESPEGGKTRGRAKPKFGRLPKATLARCRASSMITVLPQRRLRHPSLLRRYTGGPLDARHARVCRNSGLFVRLCLRVRRGLRGDAAGVAACDRKG